MARFGLDSDSDDESLALPPANGAGSSSQEQSSDEEAPPRQSLAQSDDDTMDHTDEETIQSHSDEDSFSGSVDDSFSHTERARRAGTESTYGAPSLDASEEEDDRMSASGSSHSGSDFSQAVAGVRSASVQPPAAWAHTLGLEPKRVAVMQASFFHQDTPQATASPAKHPRATPVNPFAQQTQPGTAVQRPNFSAPVIDPAPFRQLRKYARVELDRSVMAGREGSVVDEGLGLGRSFRVGCGQQGQIVHLGSLYNKPKPAKSDALAIDRLKLVSHAEVSEMWSASVCALALTLFRFADGIGRRAPTSHAPTRAHAHLHRRLPLSRPLRCPAPGASLLALLRAQPCGP